MALDHFTVTRNTTKTVLNAQRVLETVPANVPAFEFNPDGSYKGCLIEPSATNLWRIGDLSSFDLFTSQETVDGFRIATFSGDGSTVVNWSDGNDRFSDTDIATGSIVVDKTSTIRRIQIGMRGETTSAQNNVTYDLDTGDFVFVGTNVEAGVVFETARLVRIKVKLKEPTTPGLRGLRINAVDNDLTSAQNSPLIDGETIKWGEAQLEVGNVATSLIPADGSETTRNADVIERENAQDLIGQDEGSFFMRLNYIGITSSGVRFLGLESSTNNIGLAVTTPNVLRSIVNNKSDILSGNFSNQDNKILWTWDSQGVKFYLNGSEIDLPNGGSEVITSLNKIFIDGGGNVGHRTGNYKSLALYKRALTQQEAEALTS